MLGKRPVRTGLFLVFIEFGLRRECDRFWVRP